MSVLDLFPVGEGGLFYGRQAFRRVSKIALVVIQVVVGCVFSVNVKMFNRVKVGTFFVVL